MELQYSQPQLPEALSIYGARSIEIDVVYDAVGGARLHECVGYMYVHTCSEGVWRGEKEKRLMVAALGAKDGCWLGGVSKNAGMGKCGQLTSLPWRTAAFAFCVAGHTEQVALSRLHYMEVQSAGGRSKQQKANLLCLCHAIAAGVFAQLL